MNNYSAALLSGLSIVLLFVFLLIIVVYVFVVIGYYKIFEIK